MKLHINLGNTHFKRQRKLVALLREGKITLGGNKRLRIYGTLKCQSGKRMKPINRVFFISEAEAIQEGFRPCGHCMKAKHLQWKAQKKDIQS